MAEKKKFAPRRTTPVGVLHYPHVNKPDGKFNPENPVYKAPIRIEAEQAQPLIDAILADEEFGMPAAERLRADAVQKVKASGKKPPAKKDPANAEQLVPYSSVVDSEGEETGLFEFRTKSNSSYKNAKGETVKITVKLFDAKGRELVGKARPDVWGGTKARVSYTHFPWFNSATNEYGVSLRLEAVKIIELRTGGAADADSYGFGGEEDGYEADPMAADESGDAAETTTGGEVPSDDDF